MTDVTPPAPESDAADRSRIWLWVAIAAAVILVLGAGLWWFLSSARVAVPDVVGKTEAAATADITAAGLVVGTVTPAQDASATAGTVTAQSPESGTSVAKGSAVNLTVAAGPKTVAVPNVVGKSKEAALQALNDAGLSPTAIEELNDAPKGQVFGQIPTAGSQVTTGTQVVVAVSVGPAAQTGEVPAVTGKSQADAEKAVKDAGFVPVVLKEHDAQVPSGKVIAQMPDAGSQIVLGSEVVITVSLGATPSPNVAVPNVTGKAQADATTALKNVGLVAVAVSGYSDTVSAGSVIAQNPTAGTNVPSGSEVAIEVSKGKAPSAVVKVPDVVGKTESQATSAIRGAGLEPKVVKDYSDSVVAGTVIAQLPAAGSGVEPGAEVGIVVSLGKAGGAVSAVPNVVGKTAAEAEKVIAAAGFVPLKVSSVTTKTPAGIVAKQLPVSGYKADAGSQVAILVSKGVAEATAKVPDVVGKTSAEAEKTLKDLGFEPVQYQAPNADVAKGTVFAQLPKADSVVAAGAKVAVEVSTGPLEAVTLPATLPAEESAPATK